MVGRPRSAEADAAIIDAALAEYMASGYGGLCVDAVATRAGVSKATIYRRYASKLDLVMTATEAAACETSPLPDTGTLRGDLVERFRGLRDTLATSGRVMRRLVAERGDFEDLDAALQQFVGERRAASLTLLDRAQARSEISPGCDLSFAADLLAAPIFYRFFLHDELVDDAYVERLVDTVIAVLDAV